MAGLSSKRILNNTWFFITISIYAGTMVYLSAVLNVSIDEVFSLNTTSNELPEVIKKSYNFEGQPPVYFVLLSIWRSLNSGILFARLFSLLFIGLSAMVFYKLIQLLSDVANPKLFLILFLLNPYTVWAGMEIRLYAFLLFLSLTAIYFFFKFYKENENKYLLVFVVISIIGLYTQYLFVFLVAALGLSLLICKGWKLFFKFILYSVPIGVLFLYNILFTINPMKLAQINSFSTTIKERIFAVLHSPQNLILAAGLNPFPQIIRWGLILVFAGLVFYSFMLWYKKRKSENPNTVEKYYIVLISSIFLLLAFSIFFAYTALDYHDRYLTIAFPLFLLLFLVFTIHSEKVVKIIFTITGLLYLSILISVYKNPLKEYDNKSLAKYISSIENKGEPIFFYQKILTLPFKYYYTGNNTVIALPDSVKFDSTYFSKIKDTTELKNALNKVEPSAKSVLLITDRTEPKFMNDADCKLINDYLPLHYNIKLDTLFFGYSNYYSLRIRRLEKK